MISKEERLANLRRAASVTRAQSDSIDNMLAGMSDEEITNFVESNQDVQDMLTIGGDNNNQSVMVNYAEQPNKQQGISITPPWEANFVSPNSRVNLFPLGVNANYGYNNAGYYGGYNYNDERLLKYTNGMRMYNINPFDFYTANQMVDYFDYCERQREYNENQNYGWALILARGIGTEEAMKWAESFKFKPADQIYEERLKAQEDARKEQLQSYSVDEDDDIVYNTYTQSGIRYQRSPSLVISDSEGDVIAELTNPNKDNHGRSYTVYSQIDDRRREYEIQQMYAGIANHNRRVEMFTKIFNESYIKSRARWQQWENEGLSKAEQYAILEDERVDWKRHEKMLDRALRMSTFSRDTFNEVLKSCCGNLDYANRSQVFSLSYDFERDLHYKTLLSTPQEMNNDPVVHQKLQQEYDIKRKRFMDKIKNGNFEVTTATDAYYRPSLPKPNIGDLTLEDYEKPENQIMYTKMSNPDISTENMFIPPNLSNKEFVPQERIFGTMTVDDDGEILSSSEEVVFTGNITDDELHRF